MNSDESSRSSPAETAAMTMLNNGHQTLESTRGFEPTLNSEQAAALLQIHPKTIQRMARQGRIPAHRIGDLWRFRASALDEWLRSGVCSKRHSCR